MPDKRQKDLNRLPLITAWLRSTKADLIMLMECNGLTLDVAKNLAKSWGHEYVAFGQAKSEFHVMLTSRYPFADTPTVITQGFRHALIVARIVFPFGEVTAMATHLTPASGAERLLEAKIIADYVRLCVSMLGPVLLTSCE